MVSPEFTGEAGAKTAAAWRGANQRLTPEFRSLRIAGRANLLAEDTKAGPKAQAQPRNPQEMVPTGNIQTCQPVKQSNHTLVSRFAMSWVFTTRQSAKKLDHRAKSNPK